MATYKPMNNFGSWLLQELKTRDISQADLARASNITSAHMSRIISGERNPGKEALASIAHALRLPADLVFEKAGLLPPKSDLTPLQRSIMEMVKNLPDNDLSMIELMLRALSEKKVG